MRKEGKYQVRGIKIRTMNYAMILAAAVLYVVLIYMTYHISVKYEKLTQATEDYIRCEKDAAMVREASDHLTDQVRLYTVTMEPQYMEAYFEEKNMTRRREKALEDLRGYENGPEAYEYLEKALENSNQLMEREIYAMGLIAAAQNRDLSSLPQEVQDVVLLSRDEEMGPDEMVRTARDMVFDDGYEEVKELIRSNTDYFLNAVMEWTRDRQTGSSLELKKIMGQQRICISVLFILNTITFILVITLIVKLLQIYINCIKQEKMLEIAGSYEFKYLALTYNDIYEVNAANEVLLRHKAEHDPLTGVINRGAFEQMKELLKASSDPVSLLIIDVDKFKNINDGYGHEVGDQILKKTAGIISEAFRSGDYVARIGGDEFAVIMVNCTKEMQPVIQSKVDNINRTLQNPTDGLPKISLSVGAAFSEKGFSDDLYNKADRALYKVKENGRCGCYFYDENH